VSKKFEIVETQFEGRPVKVPVIPNLATLILEQVQREPQRFDMGSWHCKVGDDEFEDVPHPDEYKKCGTSHCVAGWAIVIAGKEGIELEKQCYTDDAAQLLFQHSILAEDFPSFYESRVNALSDLKAFAAREADALASQKLDGK
jgi:hypothetical protein